MKKEDISLKNFLRCTALALVILTAFVCAGCMVVVPNENHHTAIETEFAFPVITKAPSATDAPANTQEAAAPTEEAATPAPTAAPTPGPTECPVKEDGQYDSMEEVALYIHLYGHLPSNYITKKHAQSLGWTGGSLEPYAPGCSIGGDYFGNYEGLLPKKKGRSYTECDIDTKGKSSRGAKRIVFSNDGLIYYSDDHYDSFTLIYGEE